MESDETKKTCIWRVISLARLGWARLGWARGEPFWTDRVNNILRTDLQTEGIFLADHHYIAASST